MNFKIRNAILCTENTLIVLTRCATSVVRAAENDIFSQRHSFRRVELFMQHPRPSQLRQFHTLAEAHDARTTNSALFVSRTIRNAARSDGHNVFTCYFLLSQRGGDSAPAASAADRDTTRGIGCAATASAAAVRRSGFSGVTVMRGGINVTASTAAAGAARGTVLIGRHKSAARPATAASAAVQLSAGLPEFTGCGSLSPSEKICIV